MLRRTRLTILGLALLAALCGGFRAQPGPLPRGMTRLRSMRGRLGSAFVHCAADSGSGDGESEAGSSSSGFLGGLFSTNRDT